MKKRVFDKAPPPPRGLQNFWPQKRLYFSVFRRQFCGKVTDPEAEPRKINEEMGLRTGF